MKFKIIGILRIVHGILVVTTKLMILTNISTMLINNSNKIKIFSAIHL